jgi:hypothetical protein
MTDYLLLNPEASQSEANKEMMKFLTPYLASPLKQKLREMLGMEPITIIDETGERKRGGY